MDRYRILGYLAHWQDIRSQIAGDLEGYESGKWFTSREADEGGRVDTTARTMLDLRERLASLDR